MNLFDAAIGVGSRWLNSGSDLFLNRQIAQWFQLKVPAIAEIELRASSGKSETFAGSVDSSAAAQADLEDAANPHDRSLLTQERQCCSKGGFVGI